MLAALLTGAAATQDGSPEAPLAPIDLSNPAYGTMHFNTKLGSFKFLGKAETAEGRIELDFTGTVLISGLQGTLEKSGDLVLEYKEHGREVYFGTGRIVVTGRFRAIQFFGNDLTGKWRGDGVGRLYGEFDQNLQTGWYWYDEDPVKRPWSTHGLQILVPSGEAFGSSTPEPHLETQGGQP
jgi:hypothetical protein